MNFNHNHGRFVVVAGAWCPGCALNAALERAEWVRWAERMSAQIRADKKYAAACAAWNDYVADLHRAIVDGTLG